MTATTVARRRPRVVDYDTILIKVNGGMLEYLRMEAALGSHVLRLVLTRVYTWGDERHGGSRVVRLPVEDVEVILDALLHLANRMDQVKDSVNRASVVRTRMDVMLRKIRENGWTVSVQNDKHIITRSA